MIHARPPRGRPNPRVTLRLPDLALDERESAYFAPRMGDWVLLGLLVVVLLGNGLVMWHQLGPANDHTGRAIFFGLALLCALWFALVYTFKLSVSVRIGPHGVGVVRGPWRTELAWSQVARLVERVQVESGQRFRWVVVFAQDGRSMQVREDMVIDYPRFRQEVWERFRLWRDHGGTWGATGGSAFSARESSSTETLWWLVAGCAALLPGLYFALVLPELGLLGPVLLALAALCAVMGLRSRLRRQTYTVDAKTIESKQLIGRVRLAWRDVARVDRGRHKFSGLMRTGIGLGRLALKLAARTDRRVQSFDWSPRVPEYLTLRGAGRQVRIRLHRLTRPDEMLAWVEFYERQARHTSTPRQARRTAPLGGLLGAAGRKTGAFAPLAGQTDAPGAPVDPWAAGSEGPPPTADPPPPDAPTERLPAAARVTGSPMLEGNTGWLRAEPGDYWQPGTAPQRGAESPGRPPDAAREVPSAAPSPYVPVSPQEHTYARPGSDGERAHHPSHGEIGPPRETHGAAIPPADPWPDLGWGAGAGEQPFDQRAAHDAWTPPQPPANTDDTVTGETAPADEDVPAAGGESLAESFAPWRENSSWQRPALPRFGPPLTGDADAPSNPARPHGDPDEFLR